MKVVVPNENIILRLIKNLLILVIAELITEIEGIDYKEALQQVQNIAKEIDE